MGLSVPCLLVFGRHSFVNLSSEFRELVLGSERQVFVERAPGSKSASRVLDTVCAEGVARELRSPGCAPGAVPTE